MRVTQRAHAIVAATIGPGDVAVDATAGNGHDTIFLAGCVGPRGRVIAIDRQAAAIDATGRRLRELPAAVGADVTLIQSCHARLTALVPATLHGHVSCVMFNLGYLPGADHDVRTAAPTTAAAIDAGLAILRPGGIMTVVAYVGHDGGMAEVDALEARVRSDMKDAIQWQWAAEAADAATAPRLFVARKIPHA